MAYWFDVPGRELAPVSRVNGWRAASGIVEDFTAAELATLNRLLPHEGGTAILRQGLRMSGAYTVEFDTSAYWMPPADEDYFTQGWWIEALVFHVTRDLATARLTGYDPVPTNVTMNKRVRATRSIGSIDFTWTMSNNTLEGALTIPEMTVVRLGGRVFGWRDWWQECELDS